MKPDDIDHAIGTHLLGWTYHANAGKWCDKQNNWVDGWQPTRNATQALHIVEWWCQSNFIRESAINYSNHTSQWIVDLRHKGNCSVGRAATFPMAVAIAAVGTKPVQERMASK